MSTSISRDESIEVVISSAGGDILVPPPAAPLDKGKERAKEYINIKPSPSPTPIAIISRPSSSQSFLPPTKEKEKVIIDKDLLPHPAEDLSADDDLLSWILVDQLGCMPNTKLGVHPQQVKFVGPSFKTDEVLNIVKETVTKGNLQGAMQKLQEFHLIKSHLEGKMTENQRERFVSHLRRYLLPLLPNSRLEIHLTSRYSFMTGHTELAIFATRPLSPGLVMHELQGSVVPLPDQWREEMEIGEDFAVAVEAAGEETDSDAGEGSDEEDDDVSLHSSATNAKKDKGKSKEVDSNTRKGQRRSDRTKRRDFSIVWSGLKRCYQLFLGPARFLNHDCNPNVELLRQGKYVTFRVLKPIRVGDELTTFYGENYFGRNNIECLCLTCEQQCKGGFTPVSTTASGRNSRSNSRDSSAGPSRRGTSADMRESVVREMKNVGPSSLRNVVNGSTMPDDSEDERSSATAGPSQIDGDGEETGSVVPSKDEDGSESIDATPTKKKLLKITLPPSPTTESVASEPDSPIDPPPRRERVIRKVVQNIKPWSFLQRPKKHQKVDPSENDEESTEVTDDLPSDFPRCATCAKPLTEQIWFNGRYFEHCARCVRHAFIFELPWPSHRPQDVREYPPQHLIPNGFIPRKISTIPLPTLSKQPKYVKPIETVEIETAAAETKAMRQARRLRDQIAAEEFFIESLREAAWSAQEAKEAAAEAREAALKAQKEAKEEERRLRVEEKKKRDAKNIKGSGVWSRYAYLTEEEIKKKEAEKNQVLSGTRRGGRFRAREDEEEMKKLAEERTRKEQRETLERMGIDPSSPVEATHRHNGNEQDDSRPAEEEEEEEEEGDVSVASSSGTSTELIVDPRSLVRHNTKRPVVLIPRRRTEDEDDEMEVATSPVLSVLPPSKVLPKPRISISSSSSAFSSIPNPRLPSTSTSASTTRQPSTSTTFRPIAPKIVSTNNTSTGNSPANRRFYPGLPFKATPSPKHAQNGAPSASSSTKRTPIIDLTLDSDESDNDEGNNSNASGQDTTVKRKKGRPLGSGKHQKAAMKKLAKSQSQGNLSNGRISPIDLTIENEVDWKGKGKAKAQLDDSPKLNTLKAPRHVMTSGIELPDASSSSKPVVGRDRDAYSPSDPSTTIEEGFAGPDKYTIVRTPVMTRFIAPPFDFVQYHKPKPDASGSGSNSTSSIDITENTLDNPDGRLGTSKAKAKQSTVSSSSPAAVGGSGSSGEKKTPRLILNVNTSPTVGAKKVGSGSGFAGLENGGKGKEKMVYPLSSEVNREKSHLSSSSEPVGTKVVKDYKYSNGGKSVESLKPISSTSSTSTPNGVVNLNDKKRKRISDVSEASSSSSPSNQPEKKKRTFFPSMMSVSVVKPSMPLPKPKHSISK